MERKFYRLDPQSSRKKKALLKKKMGAAVFDWFEEKNFCILAGGAILSLFSSTKINDFDLFFRDPESARNGAEKFRTNFTATTVVSTSSAITLKLNGMSFQFIVLPEACGITEAVLSGFDYTTVMAAYEFVHSEFVVEESFTLSALEKKLIFNPDSKFPIAALFRVRKYLAKGFKISGVELVKIAFAIHALKFESYKDVKRQLLGIDTIFLKEFTDSLDKMDSDYSYQKFLSCLNSYIEEKFEEVVQAEEEE